MKLFVDTSAWYALNDRDDQFREKALEKLARIKSERLELITSDYIFDESVTLISTRIGHHAAVAFGDAMLKSNLATMVTISDDLRRTAFDLFRKYADKDLSFTDCTSFALMKRHKLNTAFTFDAHFQQVGFEIW
ncbi:MAG: PIN domain-containing protein [Desulfuromonadaceae bacterium]|nr:PIN domain-containing protein [Desulfuromonadaceae bacterium]